MVMFGVSEVSSGIGIVLGELLISVSEFFRSGANEEHPKIVLATCVCIIIIYLSGFEISSLLVVCNKRIRPMKLKIKPTHRVTRKCVM